MKIIEFKKEELNLLLKCVTVMQSHHMAEKSDTQNLIATIKSKWEANSVEQLTESVHYHQEQEDKLFCLWEKLSY